MVFYNKKRGKNGKLLLYSTSLLFLSERKKKEKIICDNVWLLEYLILIDCQKHTNNHTNNRLKFNQKKKSIKI